MDLGQLDSLALAAADGGADLGFLIYEGKGLEGPDRCFPCAQAWSVRPEEEERRQVPNPRQEGRCRCRCNQGAQVHRLSPLGRLPKASDACGVEQA